MGRDGTNAHALFSVSSASALGQQSLGYTRLRGAAQVIADELACIDELVQINTRINAHALQQIDHILSRHIASRTLGIRAAAEASY